MSESDSVKWGPIYWRFLHMATLLHGRVWSTAIVACLDSVIRCIPEEQASESARAFLRENPLPTSESDYVLPLYSQGPFEWVNRLHNFANRVSKPPKAVYSLIQSEIKTVDWLRLPDDIPYQETPAYTPDSPNVSSSVIVQANTTE